MDLILDDTKDLLFILSDVKTVLWFCENIIFTLQGGALKYLGVKCHNVYHSFLNPLARQNKTKQKNSTTPQIAKYHNC